MIATVAPAPTLVVLAAGLGSRYGGLKQFDPVGPHGQAILDYSVYDAARAGFAAVVFVIRRESEAVFRSEVGSRFSGALDVRLAFQDLDDVPAGFRVPADRTAPWGTAHAVRSARSQVAGPFCVINADDYYGPGSYRLMAQWCAQPGSPSDGRLRLAMVAFEVGRTLSEHGPVSRGICDVEDGQLRAVTELTGLVRVANHTENRARHQHLQAAPRKIPLDAPASMNVWGMTPEIFPVLEREFAAFLATHHGDNSGEWYLPAVVNDLIHRAQATVEVLRSSEDWFGVTYRDDAPRVRARLAALTDAGVYPERLG